MTDSNETHQPPRDITKRKAGRPVGAKDRQERKRKKTVPVSLMTPTERRALEVRVHKEHFKESETPVAIMRSNMLFWHNQVEKLVQQISSWVVNINDPDERKEAMKLVRDMLRYREMSQSCAADLAPYIHPKLANISMSDVNGNDIKIIGGLPEDTGLLPALRTGPAPMPEMPKSGLVKAKGVVIDLEQT
jgi:hypothetical protein